MTEIIDYELGKIKIDNKGIRVTALLKCPKCGRYCSLSDHEINEKGEVSPSVICGYECGFHDFIILKDWQKKIGGK